MSKSSRRSTATRRPEELLAREGHAGGSAGVGVGGAPGRARSGAPLGMLLAYPAAYRVGMSSLGFLTLYREVASRPGWRADRVFLPDRGAPALGPGRLRAWESGDPAVRFDVVGISVAHELDLGPMARLLEGLGLPPLRRDREGVPKGSKGADRLAATRAGARRAPLVVVGGPLTSINPRPLGALADLVVVGEADQAIHQLLDAVERDALASLGPEQGFWWPGVGQAPPAPLRVRVDRLPAYSDLWSPDAELSDMALVEVSRSCKRVCAFCASSRLAAGPLRLVEVDRVLDAIPADAPRVGLVGAAVSDHPELARILDALLERGQGVGVSSVRVDRLDGDLLQRLVAGGLRTLTVGVDGASERLRRAMRKGVTEPDLLRVAELAKGAGLRRMKLYQIVGLPDERDADLAELEALVRRLARVVPVTVTVTPFVPKPGTPLAEAPQLPVAEVGRRARRLQHGLAGVARVRPDSARWAWVEARIAHGDERTGEAVVAAERAGGRFADYRRALGAERAAGAPLGGQEGG